MTEKEKKRLTWTEIIVDCWPVVLMRTLDGNVMPLLLTDSFDVRESSENVCNEMMTCGVFTVKFCPTLRCRFNIDVNNDDAWFISVEMSVASCCWKKRLRFFSMVSLEKSSPSANRSTTSWIEWMNEKWEWDKCSYLGWTRWIRDLCHSQLVTDWHGCYRDQE